MKGEVKPPNRVSSAYEEFIEVFRMAGVKANVDVCIPSRPLRACFTESGDPTTAVFTICLYLKGWHCRSLARARRLDIVIKAEETLTRSSWLLTKSTVRLNYIVVSNSTARLVQSLHYDFVDKEQEDHPFFHVQLTDERIPEDDLRNTGFELNLPAQPNECGVTTRIPTADMTLASVLYCVVADHLGGSHFKEFDGKARSIQGRLPHPDFAKLRESLQKSSKHFKSSHWFAHMREPR